MKRFTLLLLVIVGVFGFVMTIQAAPPEHETFDYEYTYPLIDCGLVGGGDFWILNNETGNGRIKYFYNKDGNLIKEKGHVNGTDHLFVDGYPDHFVEGKFVSNWTAQIDPESGVYTFLQDTGIWWHIMLPGEGNIIHFSGLENEEYDPETDEWLLIKANGLQYFDLVPLCEYLSPPS